MGKVADMAVVSAAGSFKLFLGKSVSTVILALGTLIMGRLILPDDYGLYAIAVVPALMIGLFQDWGVGTAVAKYVASLRVSKEEEDPYDIVVAGLAFEIVTGAILSFLNFLVANFVASAVFGKPESAPLISLASIMIFSNALLTASQSTFIGFERMGVNSLTLVSQSIVQAIASPLLVYLGYAAFGAVLGHVVSFLVAGIAGLAMLYFGFLRKLRKTRKQKSNTLKTLKKLLGYGVPLSISTILGGFQTQYYGFMMARFVTDTTMIGNYQMASNFAILLTFFTFPIGTVLFPAFAKLDPKNEHQLLRTVFTSSVKYTSLLLIPATMAVMVLSNPMVSTLFGREKWLYAPFFLVLYVINNLSVLVGNLSMASLLSGVGETRTLMKLGILSVVIAVPLAYFLIPPLGIVGVILGTMIAGLPSMFLGLHWTWKHYGVKADLKSSVKILISSAAAAIAAYLSLNLLDTSDWIRLAGGGAVFLTVYTLATPLIGAISQADIDNLRTMFSGLGVISKLINVLLGLVERIARNRPRRRTLLMMVGVALIAIALGTAIALTLDRTLNLRIPSTGKLHTRGVETSGGELNLTEDGVPYIDWGAIFVGTLTNRTINLRSKSNVNTTLHLNTTNWNPTDISQYFNLSWNYTGTPITPNETVSVVLTLEVSSSSSLVDYLITNRIEEYSFDIMITAEE